MIKALGFCLLLLALASEGASHNKKTSQSKPILLKYKIINVDNKKYTKHTVNDKQVSYWQSIPINNQDENNDEIENDYSSKREKERSHIKLVKSKYSDENDDETKSKQFYANSHLKHSYIRDPRENYAKKRDGQEEYDHKSNHNDERIDRYINDDDIYEHEHDSIDYDEYAPVYATKKRKYTDDSDDGIDLGANDDDDDERKYYHENRNNKNKKSFKSVKPKQKSEYYTDDDKKYSLVSKKVEFDLDNYDRKPRKHEEGYDSRKRKNSLNDDELDSIISYFDRKIEKNPFFTKFSPARDRIKKKKEKGFKTNEDTYKEKKSKKKKEKKRADQAKPKREHEAQVPTHSNKKEENHEKVPNEKKHSDDGYKKSEHNHNVDKSNEKQNYNSYDEKKKEEFESMRKKVADDLLDIMNIMDSYEAMLKTTKQ